MPNHVFESKFVKTRKEHFCEGCANKYKKGIRMFMIRQVYDDLFSTTYFCLNCNEVLEYMNSEWGNSEFNTGELEEDWEYLDQNYNLEYEKQEVSGEG